MSQVKIIARCANSLHSELLGFVLDADTVQHTPEGELIIAPFQAAIVQRQVVRLVNADGDVVEGDPAGSDYFGLSAPVTSVEIISESVHDVPLPRAPETPDSQPASSPAPQAPEPAPLTI